MENYEVITKIGSGACGAVYLARSLDNGKQYALKKVQLDEHKRSRTREALLREARFVVSPPAQFGGEMVCLGSGLGGFYSNTITLARSHDCLDRISAHVAQVYIIRSLLLDHHGKDRILAKLKHPHIVVYHDSFFDSNADADYMHIVQDYCDGGTLDDKIIHMRKDGKFFEESTIMEWFIQIAMAIQYIHFNKILHRDLKSQNVFMTKKDGVKLGDFGIAKVLDSTLDAAVTCVGTPCYLSPELCEDIPYSSKSDIWALGCLLFELCALKPAFDAHNLISLFYKITRAEYSQLPDHYSSEIKELIKNILIKSPENRPSASAILNMATVRNYLEVFIHDREYLLQQKIISLKAKSSSHSGQSSPSTCRKLKNSETGAISQAVRHSTPNIQSKIMSSLPALRRSHDPLMIPSECHKTNGQGLLEPAVEQKPSVSPNYSDDFDSSSSHSSSDNEDEIPEELSAEADICSGLEEIAVTLSPLVSKAACQDEEDAELMTAAAVYGYDDDFEDDSEAEELDEIISKAKEAHTLQAADEYIVDESSPTTSTNKQSIKQYLESLMLDAD